MLFSIAIILLTGFILSGIFEKLKLPGLLGMLISGILLGPHMLNLISKDIISLSPDLRQIALIVILTRAGLNLDIDSLKKVGRPAILMCFIPAIFEIITVTVLANIIFKISYIEGAIMGCVLAAVSPAVIVPKMVNFIENGYGKDNSIPEIIMAGASVDDIFVIVLFTSFLGIYQGGDFNIATLLDVPISILLGIMLGVLCGLIFTKLFKIIHMRDTIKVLLILSTSFILVSLETFLKGIVPISGLLAVMSLSCTILKQHKILAVRLSNKFSKLWVGFELLLFVLVGACVDINYLSSAGLSTLFLILFALIFRMCGVFVCLLKTKLSNKEKLFCAIAYMPKATVQAAIGYLPLAAGVASGNIILTAAVLSIIVTAPLGAIGVDISYKKLLSNNNPNIEQDIYSSN